MSRADFRLSLVVPVYNEEESIDAFISAIDTELAPLKDQLEIVFVNDGSRDRTREVVEQAIARDPRVTLVNLARNFGKERAMTAGIDAAGAEGALRAGGRCIGVLGVPHECENGRLAQDVAAVGALISEYPPGTVPQSNFFRARNRITAGLSVGVAVVEAPIKSGTRLFAAEAADQGKEIFAVPGNADADNCAGSNAILKEGAKPVTDGWEIMCEFEGLFPQRVCRPGAETMETPPVEDEKKSAETAGFVKIRESRAKKVIDKEKPQAYIDLQAQLKNLNEDQLKIVSAIKSPNTHVDDIIDCTGLTPAKVLAGLTILQLKGMVKQESGKRFTLNILTK